MALEIAVQREADWAGDTDWDALAARAVEGALRRTAQASLITGPTSIEVSIRLTGDDEVRVLNAHYRGKDKPTNVLSFPMVQADLLETLANTDDGEVLLGDIVLAAGVCRAEAAERGVSMADHATHLIVHGTFHLLGYDHQGDAEAETMESLERETMAALGLHDPYRIDEDRG
ncbi:MAG: rRNA maturation RNase YbeY [Sphingomonas sp. SCN 67-18]|uniref:rRNA maturation RNase YbeY n=1 Tax=uncultured Sphingomonas sp. TaxID=158754 RepID=UPI00086C3E32|nr:rRNA maturation RNase YbeY [Sphingomonas sp. SCN 67-18]ODU20985.1 MAG: rRNA maturation RNase YbeY [Sphingomonas sp. SCN 67-18]